LLAVAVAGGAGAVFVLVLAVTGAADRGPAILAAVLLGVLTLILFQVVRGAAAREETPASSDDEGPPPYGLVLESLPDPVMLLSIGRGDLATPRYLFANTAARELFRIGRPHGLLAAAVRSPQVLEAADEALVGRIEGRTTLEPSGVQERIWQVVARPLHEAGETERMALLWLHDETDARRAERMRADFLANASHELRTPLASLTGFIETLRGHAKDDENARDRFLTIMSAQADRMSRLIADLLSLSRIELNEHIAPQGEADIDFAVKDVLDAVTPLAQEGGVRIEVRLEAGGAGAVQGDRDQIIQVIQNLVDNAVKYAGQGGVVTVETASGAVAEDMVTLRREGGSRLSLLKPDHAAGERYAAISVTDSGPGIARENLPRLTERFYRVEGQKSGERSGTGLGLAIVKHIVNRHKGGLAVESVAGEGATFTAYFPIGKPAASRD
jgi:two-component system phosphate regulon sensor histidine kinase PhoR